MEQFRRVHQELQMEIVLGLALGEIGHSLSP
ncbi:MAG: hypothetical protein JWR37_2047 [Mycobacterium sp.]|nr:hypothetical protein [Mycobacterium sp.]